MFWVVLLQIPFYPVVSKDLRFAHDGNKESCKGLINFETLRMISRYIRDMQNMCSTPYVSISKHFSLNFKCNPMPLILSRNINLLKTAVEKVFQFSMFDGLGLKVSNV